MAQMVNNQPANAGDIRDVGSITWLGKSPGGGHGNPSQYSCLENSMDRGIWQSTVYKSQRIGCDWSDLAFMQANTHINVHSKWQHKNAWLPGGSEVKESAHKTGDLSFISGSRRFPGEEWQPLQYSCLENPMDGGARQATVLRVTNRHDWANSFSHSRMLEKNLETCQIL